MICDFLVHARRTGARLIAPAAEAEAQWGAHVKELADGTLFSQTDS